MLPVAVPELVLNALAEGEAADAAHSALVTPYLAGVECIGLWRIRSKQIVETPADAPEHRRKGYARQALETLLAVASTSANVHIIRATISPDNHVSRSLVEGYGFTEVGEQWDDEEGLEIIFEVAARA
ncbi:putative acetyltransferase GNAT family [Leifsonia rubra CMS 76R]|nr:putative acetyltransferase GNAT family [Leifsonia rubra CMS 76R]